MTTMVESIIRQIDKVVSDISNFVSEFTEVIPVKHVHDAVKIISPWGNHSWKPLPLEGKQAQIRLLNEFDRMRGITKFVTNMVPRTAKGSIATELRKIRAIISQDRRTWYKTKTEVLDNLNMYAKELSNVIGEYCGHPSAESFIIADTNALLTNPDIETWHFKGIKRFTLLLTPTMLRELDKLKILHSNEHIRKKANSIIRKLREYRRRGNLTEGVSVVNGRISVRAIAPEPDMTQTLPWLDAENADDRFLATTLEVIREHLDTAVFIVTADLNMQNKADFAGISSFEVPTPAKDGA